MSKTLFKMPFIFVDASGTRRVGIAATDQHTYWNHAEKELVRACRSIKGYREHGCAVVAAAEFAEKLKDDGRVLLEYVGENGGLISELVHPGSDAPREEPPLEHQVKSDCHSRLSM